MCKQENWREEICNEIMTRLGMSEFELIDFYNQRREYRGEKPIKATTLREFLDKQSKEHGFDSNGK